MPDTTNFRLAVDIPLAVIVTSLFLWHIQRYARTSGLQVNLLDRLPAARYRIVLFFVLLAVFCWYINLAFWFLFGLISLIGFVMSLIFGGNGELGIGALIVTAYVIREWAFGFPQIRLQPPDCLTAPKIDEETCELIGARGKTLSPLRPCGDAEIDGKVVSVISNDNSLLDKDCEVEVVAKRNGTLCVNPVGST